MKNRLRKKPKQRMISIQKNRKDYFPFKLQKRKANLITKKHYRIKQIDLPTGLWRLFASTGYEGTLFIESIDPKGFVEGTLSASYRDEPNSIRGFYDRMKRKLTFIRFRPGGSPSGYNNQTFEGYFQVNGAYHALSGWFITFGSARKHKLGWFAEKYISLE